jgi:hypothetical protein
VHKYPLLLPLLLIVQKQPLAQKQTAMRQLVIVQDSGLFVQDGVFMQSRFRRLCTKIKGVFVQNGAFF